MNRNVWKFLATLVAGALVYAFPVSAAEDYYHPKLVLPLGMSAEVGGGVRTFLASQATDVTKPGGSWTARFVVGTRSYLGAEAAYFGSAQAIDAIGLQQSAMLLSHGAEGLIRLNASTGAWQPYAVGGVAWRRYTLENSAFNTSSVLDSDDVAEIPMGVGIAYRTGGLILDARAMYNNSFGQRLIPNANLSSLNFGVKVGFEF